MIKIDSIFLAIVTYLCIKGTKRTFDLPLIQLIVKMKNFKIKPLLISD